MRKHKVDRPHMLAVRRRGAKLLYLLKQSFYTMSVCLSVGLIPLAMAGTGRQTAKSGRQPMASR